MAIETVAGLANNTISERYTVRLHPLEAEATKKNSIYRGAPMAHDIVAWYSLTNKQQQTTLDHVEFYLDNFITTVQVGRHKR